MIKRLSSEEIFVLCVGFLSLLFMCATILITGDIEYTEQVEDQIELEGENDTHYMYVVEQIKNDN